MTSTILYVEDNVENQQLVRRVLEHQGYKLVIADDGLSGVRMAQEIHPDLILMDINLPGMDGYAAATRIKSFPELSDVPVVALTANAMLGDRERTLAAGCDGYLQKPIDIDELTEAVSAFLQGRREALQGAEKESFTEEYIRKLASGLESRIEELQRANEELRQLDRLKSEFVSTVSHELRTPLNIIIGHGELLEDQIFGPLNDHQARYVSNIVQSARHLHDLVQDILDLSKIESGRLTLNREQFSLTDVISELKLLLEPLAEQRQVYLSFEIEDDLVSVVADRLRFKQIVQNLVSNAIKFTPESGNVVCIFSGPTPGLVQIEVIDTGIGIAAEDHAMIFERFRQVDASAARAEEGTGLGLTLTREFAELHDGTVSVKSDLGKGSTFTVIIPQATL